MQTDIKDNDLGRELQALQAELVELNTRRADLYRRSLEASQDNKAVQDFISNMMLNGPLSDRQQISYPLQVNGIEWTADNPPVLTRDPKSAWVEVMPHGTNEWHLGIHVADFASAVEARLGTGNLLHLRHVAPVQMLYVPYLGRTFTVFEAAMRPIETLKSLDKFRPDPEFANPWFDLAVFHVTQLEAENPQPEADEKATATPVVPDELH